jgi:hypothetical protein
MKCAISSPGSVQLLMSIFNVTVSPVVSSATSVLYLHHTCSMASSVPRMRYQVQRVLIGRIASNLCFASARPICDGSDLGTSV